MGVAIGGTKLRTWKLVWNVWVAGIMGQWARRSSLSRPAVRVLKRDVAFGLPRPVVFLRVGAVGRDSFGSWHKKGSRGWW